MGDDDEGLAVFVLEAEHFVEDMLGEIAVERAGGLDREDQIPGLQYASCEGDALLFTAGEGHDLVSRDMAESEPGEHGLGLALPDLFAVTGEAHAEGDVVKGAHVVVGGAADAGKPFLGRRFVEIGGSLRQQASMKALRMRRWLLSAR